VRGPRNDTSRGEGNRVLAMPAAPAVRAAGTGLRSSAGGCGDFAGCGGQVFEVQRAAGGCGDKSSKFRTRRGLRDLSPLSLFL